MGKVNPELDGAIDLLQRGEEIKPNLPSAAHMYEVNISAEPHQLLDWDKPIAEQPEGVRAKLQEAYPGVGENHGFHVQSAFPYGIRPAISDTLNKSGIPGIQYLDQGSRSAGQGTHNYVIFDPNIVSIIRKYGWLPAALTGGTMTQPNQQ